MKLTIKQQRFIEYVDNENKKKIDIHDVNDMFKTIILNLFRAYLTSEKDDDRIHAASLISRIHPKYRNKIKIWDVLDGTTLREDIKESIRIKNRTNIHSQKNRHGNGEFDSMTYEEWEETLEHFGHACAYCGTKGKMSFDHVHPFSKGGNFIKANIIPACLSCNCSKQAHDLEEWYQSKSFFDEESLNKINKFVEKNAQLTMF